MKQLPSTNRKQLILGLLALGVLWCLWFVLTHSIVTITGEGEQKKAVYLHWGDDPLVQKHFELTDDSKTFIVPRGSYSVEASFSDRLTVYNRKAGGLSKQNLRIKVLPQKKANHIGVSEGSCSLKPGASTKTFFYPCSNYKGFVFEGQNERQPIEDPLLAKVNTPDNTHDNHEAEHLAGADLTISKYVDGVLTAASVGGKLYINHWKLQNSPVDYSITEIDGFNGKINSSVFSTVSGGRNPKFAALDLEKRKLLIFDDAGDKNPTSIDLSKELDGIGAHSLKSVLISDNMAYVLITKDPSELEDHSHLDEEAKAKRADSEKTDKIEQKVIAIDTKKPTAVKTHKISDEKTPLKSGSSPSGNLFFLPLYLEKSKPYLIADDKITDLELPSTGVKDFCWQGKDDLYYSNTDNQIFRYSFLDQASFLEYSNSEDQIGNLNCAVGQTHFTLSTERDGITDRFVHYSLTNESSSGVRLEQLLPLYLKLGEDTIKVSQTDGVLVVDLIVDGDNNGSGPPQEEAKQRVSAELKNKGSNETAPTFEFKYR